MRTDHGALVALDAVVHDPFGHVDGHPALFILGGADRKNAVRRERAHRQLVALLGQHGLHHLGDPLGFVAGHCRRQAGIGPGRRNLHLYQVILALVHGLVVHVDDLVALPAEQLVNLVLEVGDGFVHGDHVGRLEEGGLHDHVDASAQTHIPGNLDRVDVVELELFAGDGAAHGHRQFFFHVCQTPGTVEHEGPTDLDAFQHVVRVDVRRIMAGDIIGTVDQIRGPNGCLAETQVGDGDTA